MKNMLMILVLAVSMVPCMTWAGGEDELAMGRQCMALQDLNGAERHFRAAMREGNLMAHTLCAAVLQMKGSPSDLREAARVLRSAMRLPDADKQMLSRLIQMLESSASMQNNMDSFMQQNRSSYPQPRPVYHNWQNCTIHGRYDAALTFRCPGCSAPKYLGY